MISLSSSTVTNPAHTEVVDLWKIIFIELGIAEPHGQCVPKFRRAKRPL
jgi:hypothetical protein